MKYSQLIGITAAILMIIVCYFPWITISSLNITLSGINGHVNEHLTFGKQIYSQIFFSAFLVLFFSLQKVWAKRINLFFGLINLSWAIKNFTLFSICRQGICPEKQPALYIQLFLSILILICVLTPKINFTKSD